MVELIALILVPAAGGALAQRLWMTRRPRVRHTGMAVGEVPQRLRRRNRMAIRRGVAHE